MKKIILFLLTALFLTSCASLQKTEQTKELMGTFVTITVYNENKETAEKAIEEALKEIERIENILSIYKNDSEVSRLNRDKIIKNPSSDLMENVKKSVYYGNLSEGAFDITVQPILDLYTKSFSVRKRPPTESEIKEASKSIDYKKIIIANNSISIGTDQKMTLGGIAKGYAVDKAIEVLQNQGIKHALVDMKSSIKAIGNKGSEDWTITLQNPRNPEEYITIINLNNKSISTSGDYERFFNENKTFHHIINPATGYSATELISVTVITDKAIDADALSTSVFVLGKEKGLELIESLDNVEGLIITKEKEVIRSKGFKY